MRCEQQSISEGLVKAIVKTLPPAKGSFKWRTNGIEIVYTQRANKRVIISVIGSEKLLRSLLRRQRKIMRCLS
jgi:hypothetical protein